MFYENTLSGKGKFAFLSVLYLSCKRVILDGNHLPILSTRSRHLHSYTTQQRTKRR